MKLCSLFISANSMRDEIFVPVKDFENRFWISNFGRIISHNHRNNTIKFLRPHLDSLGYYATQLRMKPINRRVRVHVLVAEHFVSRSNTSHTVVNHLSGIKTDNYFENLEWTTIGDNVRHSVRIGCFNIKGERHPMSKLKTEDVIRIREMYNAGKTHKEIAEIFGVSRRQVGDIVNCKNWGWLV